MYVYLRLYHLKKLYHVYKKDESYAIFKNFFKYIYILETKFDYANTYMIVPKK